MHRFYLIFSVFAKKLKTNCSKIDVVIIFLRNFFLFRKLQFEMKYSVNYFVRLKNHVFGIALKVFMYVCLFIKQQDPAYGYLSVYQDICVDVYMYLCTSIYMSVDLCICIYVCMYIYLYVYLCRCKYLHKCWYIFMYICACIYASMRVYIFKQYVVNRNLCSQICVHIYMCVCIYMWIFIFVSIYVRKYNIYTYMSLFACMCECVCMRLRLCMYI